MITLLFSSRFHKAAKMLDNDKQEKSAFLLDIFKEDPFDSRLHSKALSGKLAGIYSFRITRDWRVFYRYTSPQITFIFEIRHRKEAYR